MPDFNGVTLTITLDSGITEVQVQDIYEAWKDWLLEHPSRRGFPQAFRPDGGAPLTSIINQGSYFFLRNDLGWRIKPPEEDITIFLVGNLAVEDTTLGSIIPTLGAFTASIIGLQPVTQGVTPIMGTQLAYSSFEGAVWIDQSGSLSGTGTTASGAPIGNAENPVNNIPDAVAIISMRGLPRTMNIVGNLTLDTGDDISNIKMIGENPARTSVTVNTAALTLACEFNECSISGTLDGLSIIRFCSVQDINYFSGFLYESEIKGTITLGSGAQAAILGCYSGNAGQSTATIDFGGSGQTLSLRKYSGGVLLTNKTGADSASIDLIGGQVRLDLTTVTNGNIVVRGTGKVVDDIDGDWLPHGTYGSLILDNETTYGLLLQELWTAHGLDPDVPATVGTRFDDIASDVWEINTTGIATALNVQQIHGQVSRCIYIDTELVPLGNGYQQTPWNNWSDAVDDAEALNLLELVIVSDATVDRQLKNFSIRGLGLPTLDLNGQIMENTIFRVVGLTGSHLGVMQTIECALFNLSGLSGVYFTVSLAGVISPAAGGNGALLWECSPAIAGQPWECDMGAVGDVGVSIQNSTGGVKVTNMNSAGDVFHFNGLQGELTIDATCTLGEILVTGGVSVVDNSTGATVITRLLQSEITSTEVWTGTDGAPVVNDITFLKDIEGGRWKLDSALNQMIFYKDDNVTEIARFDTTNAAGSPAVTDVRERVRV